MSRSCIETRSAADLIPALLIGDLERESHLNPGTRQFSLLQVMSNSTDKRTTA